MSGNRDGGPGASGLDPETLAAQALGRVDPRTGALVPAIHPSTTFERAADGSYPTGRGYARPHNPTYDEPAELLAALEGGRECLLFASGMAAGTAVFQSLLPGDHVVVSRIMYWALRKWLIDFAMPWGLAVEFVDATDPAAVQGAVRPGRTRVVWIETPANPTWEITDIAATARIAHDAGARLVVDATVATPVLTRPLALGADLVVHSATKYLNGHGDVLAGAVVCREQDAFWQRVRACHRDGGAVLGSFEAWLLQRGMRTLYLRVRRASESALTLARRLQSHPAVAEVLYPGLQSHPGHAVARAQMDGGFGGMLSIRVHGGEAAAMAVAAGVQVFKRATSLGGVESLIEHRASIEGPATPVPRDLLRLSVGLESLEDLAADLVRALDGVLQGPGAGAAGTASPAGSPAATGDEAAAAPAPVPSPGQSPHSGGHAAPGSAVRGARPGGPPPGPATAPGGAAGPAEDPATAPGGVAAPAEDPAAVRAVAAAAEQVVREQIAPVVAERGGSVRVAGLADGVLLLALDGSPAAAVPILDTLRGILCHHVPAIRDVRVVAGDDGGAEDAAAPGAPPSDQRARVERVLASRINPAVAAHGGRILVDAVRDGSVYLRFEGGCQGCAMAEVTLRQGVEPLIREAAPETVAVVDVTDHPAGAAPFFRTRKGPA